MKHTCRQVGTKKNENVIPAEAGIQTKKRTGFRVKHGMTKQVDFHMKLNLIIMCLFLFIFHTEAYPAEKENMQFTKQPELQQIRPKKPVRIKLRRTDKDGYTWELTGDDADEIIKIDRKLRKSLKVQ